MDKRIVKYSVTLVNMLLKSHNTLTMTNHYASLMMEYLRQSQEKFSPVWAKDVSGDEDIGGIIGVSSLKVWFR